MPALSCASAALASAAILIAPTKKKGSATPKRELITELLESRGIDLKKLPDYSITQLPNSLDSVRQITQRPVHLPISPFHKHVEKIRFESRGSLRILDPELCRQVCALL